MLSNNREYKVISLLIKIIIFTFSFWFIFHKLKTTSLQIDIKPAFNNVNGSLLVLTFFLMFINWGLEAFKWKYLIRSLEKITFQSAYKSIFSGVTVSIFMPNRIGEFAGRIFFLEKADKLEATLKNVIGSLMQFFMTLLFGIAASFILIQKGINSQISIDAFDLKLMKALTIVIILIAIAVTILNKYRINFPEKVQLYFKAFFDVPKSEILSVFIISFFRYTIFLFQYYLVLLAFGVQMDVSTGLLLIAVIFLITSVIPTFALTEVATRGATAVFLFSSITSDATGVLISSFIVWIINLAIPALIGSIFIWKLKFFK
jgi:uncharacterized membrane protein YbhN (UPF0104 family)